jgi:DNA-binding NtrC family response regulator
MSDFRPRVLLLHDDASLLRPMAEALARQGELATAAGAAEALEHLAAAPFDLLVLTWPDLPLLQQVRQRHPDTLVIGLDAGREPGARVRALEAGLQDLLPLPPDPRELELVAGRCLASRRMQREISRLRDAMARREEIHLLPGISLAAQAARRALLQAASSDVPVLLTGETGTGREGAARALHAAGPRRAGPFVGLDASAFRPHVLDEEIFGATPAGRPGRLAAARSGTLFLAEVTALPIDMQVRLREHLAGASGRQPEARPAVPDVRLIASAGEDIETLADAGRFDRALYRLLSAITVRMPPLRERPEDLPVLAAAFLDQLCRQNHAGRRSFSPDAVEALVLHSWRGNIRELRHVVECLVLQPGAELVTRRDLPRALQAAAATAVPIAVTLPDGGLQLDQQMAGYERALLRSALDRASGRKKEAATLLGLNKDQMKYLCRKHGL